MKWIKLTSILLFLVVLSIYIYLKPRLPIINGYAAKVACGCHFHMGMNLQDIYNQDLKDFPLNYADVKIDIKNKIVHASFFGLGTKTVEYKENIGCVLLKDEDDHNIFLDRVTVNDDQDTLYFLDSLYEENQKLTELLDSTVSNDKDTRAMLIIHNDTLIYEYYGQGIERNTPLLGWSMTKSVMSALIGIYLKENNEYINQSSLFKEWEDDSRKNITLENLLSMNSGLEWLEDYTVPSDATEMLFDTEDIVMASVDNPLKNRPGEVFYYSSGTTNLLSGWLKNKLKDEQEYLNYPYKKLFGPLGMNSSIIETDESGNYIASSFMYASALDWAKFGLLYLHDGYLGNDQLLPEGWTRITRTNAPGSEGQYGMQFWLNRNGSNYPDLPDDLYFADGYQGQRVFIFPSQNMVVVRLGLAGHIDFNGLLKKVISEMD